MEELEPRLLEQAFRDPVWRWFCIEGTCVLGDGVIGVLIGEGKVVGAGVEVAGVAVVWS